MFHQQAGDVLTVHVQRADWNDGLERLFDGRPERTRTFAGPTDRESTFCDQ